MSPDVLGKDDYITVTAERSAVDPAGRPEEFRFFLKFFVELKKRMNTDGHGVIYDRGFFCRIAGDKGNAFGAAGGHRCRSFRKNGGDGDLNLLFFPEEFYSLGAPFLMEISAALVSEQSL